MSKPLVNIGIIVGDSRDRLTEQCIRSLYEHTDMSLCDVTVIANATQNETTLMLIRFAAQHGFYLGLYTEALGGGAVTNRLLEAARGNCALKDVHANQGNFLYHTASDFYFHPGWLDAMLVNFPVAEAMGVGLFGAYSHPYHQPDGPATKGVGGYSIQPRQMVAGGSWMMRWETWDKYGPLSEEHKGLYVGGEDTAFNFKLIEVGVGRATIVPEVTVHTGRTNSMGNSTIGAEYMPDIEGIIIE